MTRVIVAFTILTLFGAAAYGGPMISSYDRLLAEGGRLSVGTPRSAAGDIYSAAAVAFSDAGGMFLDTGGPSGNGTYTFGGPITDLGNNIFIDSNESISGNQHTLTLRIFSTNFFGFVSPGMEIGGDAIGALNFNIGESNAGFNPIQWDPPMAFTIDGGTVDFLANNSSVVGGPGALLVNPPMGTAGVRDNGGTGLSLTVGVFVGDGAGGLDDISGFGIDEVVMNLEVTEVPEPATLGLLSCAGLILVRRRRSFARIA